MATPLEGDNALQEVPIKFAQNAEKTMFSGFRTDDNVLSQGTFKGFVGRDTMIPGVTNHMNVDVKNTDGSSSSREYDVYLPVGYDGKKPLPVLFVLHGVVDGNGKGLMEAETGMNNIADARQKAGDGFMVVYPVAGMKDFPNSGGLTKVQDWNSPGAGLTETNPSYDDVDYFKAMVNALKNNDSIKVDADRMYLSGFSSGGEFSRHLRASMPHTFAGVASVHGTRLGTEANTLPGDHAVDISIVSNYDDMLPATGGRGLMTLPFSKIANSRPLEQAPRAAADNGCTGLPTVSRQGNFLVTEYRGGQCNGYPVKEFFLDGDWRAGKLGSLLGRGATGPAQHAWDGTGQGGWPIVGDKNRSIDTSQLVVDELFKYKRSQEGALFRRQF
jgi:poly(3-hydroxybutyrate) depolymerase